jgi:23S rRNA pseudouridine1911/1915/1917 synthase
LEIDSVALSELWPQNSADPSCFELSNSTDTEESKKMKKNRPSLRRTLAPNSIKVLYEDQEIIVIEKPAGLLTMATEKEKHRTVYAILYDHVKKQRPPEKIFIVHRLDREASGLLVFAKQEAAKFNLQQQFRQHSAGRIYTAVVEGRFKPEEQTIQTFLAENSIHRCYSTPDAARGKLSVTHIHVLARAQHYTLLEAILETGRKHQIRVHLSEQGHPIAGDKVYGSQTNPLHRLALHASQLKFRHPRTGKKLEYCSPLPAAFSILVPRTAAPSESTAASPKKISVSNRKI